jgi:hypothetical protein
VEEVEAEGAEVARAEVTVGLAPAQPAEVPPAAGPVARPAVTLPRMDSAQARQARRRGRTVTAMRSPTWCRRSRLL